MTNTDARPRPRRARPGGGRAAVAAVTVAALAAVLALWLWLRPADQGSAALEVVPAVPEVASRSAPGALEGRGGAGLATAAAPSAGQRFVAAPGVRLAGDGVLEGRVVDVESGANVAGASVELLSLPPLVGVEAARMLALGSFRSDMRRRVAPIATAVTDGGGGFAFAGVRRGRYYLHARGAFHVPHAAVSARVVPSGAGGPIDVPVRAGGALRGVVLDAAGRPAAGARVALYQGATAIVDALRRGDAALLETATGGDGTFLLAGIPPGNGYDLSAWSERLTLSHATGFSVRAGETTDVVVRGRAGGGVRGRVLASPPRADGDGAVAPGQPTAVEGALVGAVPRGLRDLTFVAAVLERTGARTDAGGNFALEGVPPGEVDVVAWAPGLLPVHRAGVAVGPGGSADAGELVLGRGPILRGRVVDAAGRPVPDVRLRWDMVDWRGLELDFSFAPFLYQALDELLFPVTDADGRFEAGPFAGRPRYELWMIAAGFGLERYRWDPEADGNDVEVVLTRGGAVEGIVIDQAAAKPITSFTIESIGRVEEAFDAPSPLNPFSGGVEVEHPEGRFRVDGLTAGRGRITVEAEGYRPAVVEGLPVVEGETHRGVIVKLQPALELRGSVVDEAGAPVVGAVVIPLDGDGRITAGPRRDALDDTPFEFLDELRALAPIDIAGGLGIFAEGSALSDSAGRFTLEGLAPGEVRVAALHRDHAPSTSDTVTLGEDAAPPEVVVVLERGGRIEGVVEDLRGDPVPDAVVIAARAPSRGSGGRTGLYQGTSDAEGGYAIEHVPAGSYFVALTRGDEALDPLSFLGSLGFDLVTVPRTGTVRLDLVDRSAAATRVFGLVRSGGAPVSGGALLALDFEGDNLLGLDLKIARVEPTGRYEFAGLAPGTYRFQYQSGRDESGLAVEIPERPDFRLDIDLPSGRIEGRVVDAVTGEPIPRASVAARREGQGGGKGLLGSLFALESGVEDERADGAGDFRFDALEAGRWSLVASGPRWGGARDEYAASDPLVVEVASGRTTGGLRFELEPSLSVAGRVVDEFARPVPGAVVRVVPLADAALEIKSAGTDADGAFRVVGLSPGSVDVVAEASGYAPARIEDRRLSRGTPTDVELVLTRGTELRVRAYVAGQPAAGAVGRVERLGSATRERARATENLLDELLSGRGLAGADGRLDFGRLAPGRYRIEVSRGSLRAVLEEVEVDGPAPLELRVDLR